MEWHRARLGKITGSQVGRLMKKGKTSYFGDDAMSYIYQLAYERTLASDVMEFDDEFELYLDHVNVETKAMRFGTEMEATARLVYCSKNNVECTEVGLCEHFDIENFGSSPDGIVETPEGRVAIEIKCPSTTQFMRYCDSVWAGETLKKVKPEYYWQCMAHMMCTGAVRTDFVVFSPFSEFGIHVAGILPNEEDMNLMRERIEEANVTIEEIINKLKKSNKLWLIQ